MNLDAVETWIADLEKLYTARAAYYGEERLLKQDITFAKALLAQVRVLEVELHKANYCSCGRKLSRGMCGICDNDD